MATPKKKTTSNSSTEKTNTVKKISPTEKAQPKKVKTSTTKKTNSLEKETSKNATTHPARPRKPATPKTIPHASSWEIRPNPRGEDEPEVLVLRSNNKDVVSLELRQENLMDLMDALNDKLFVVGATDVDAWYLRDAHLDNLKGVLSFSANHAIVGSLSLDDDTLKKLVPTLLKYYDPRKSWSKTFWTWVMSHKVTAGALAVIVLSLITIAVVFSG